MEALGQNTGSDAEAGAQATATASAALAAIVVGILADWNIPARDREILRRAGVNGEDEESVGLSLGLPRAAVARILDRFRAQFSKRAERGPLRGRAARARDREWKAALASLRPIPCAGTYATGTMFGPWRTEAFIARGHTAEVYRAVHSSLAIQAAVKVLARDADAATRARFENEARFLYDHKGLSAIPTLYTAGEEAGAPFFAIELLSPIYLPHHDAEVAGFVLAVTEALVRLRRCRLSPAPPVPSDFMARANGEPVLTGLSSHEGRGASASDCVCALGRMIDACFRGVPQGPWRRIVRKATHPMPERRYAGLPEFARAVRARHRAVRTFAALAATTILAAIAAAIAVATVSR